MYAKEVERVISVPGILELTADKMIYKIISKNEVAPYITYNCYDDRVAFGAEGERKSTRYFIQIDINSKNTNFKNFKKEIYKQAKINNWTREGGTFESYDDKTKLFFSCLRFSFVLEEDLNND